MKRSLILFAALSATVATPLVAQLPTTPPPIGAPKAFKLPATESYTLANGMRVTLVPYGIAPKAVVSLRTFTGNITEGEDTWLSDMTAEMMKEGAGGRSATDLAAAAAAMGGDLTTSVTAQQTTIGTQVLSEYADDAVGLVAAVAMRPDFPASEFGRVKANYERRLVQLLAQPGTLANVALARATYGTAHPYGRLLPGATQLAGYTIDDVKSYYAANFGAKRSHLYIAGRFDSAAVKAAIAAAFDGWAAGPDRLSLPATAKPGPQVILVDRPGAPQSTLRLAFPAPLAGSEADIDTRVMNALLGGSFSSRITTNIRESKGYTYSPSSGISFQPENAQWVFNADVTTTVTGPALKEVFSEVRRLQSEAPAAEETAGIRNYLAGTFAIANSTAPAVVNTLATRDTLRLPADWLDRYVPAVLAVTPAELSEAAKALPLDKMTLVVVGDLKTVEPQLRALPELRASTFKR